MDSQNYTAFEWLNRGLLREAKRVYRDYSIAPEFHSISVLLTIYFSSVKENKEECRKLLWKELPNDLLFYKNFISHLEFLVSYGTRFDEEQEYKRFMFFLEVIYQKYFSLKIKQCLAAMNQLDFPAMFALEHHFHDNLKILQKNLEIPVLKKRSEEEGVRLWDFIPAHLLEIIKELNELNQIFLRSAILGDLEEKQTDELDEFICHALFKENLHEETLIHLQEMLKMIFEFQEIKKELKMELTYPPFDLDHKQFSRNQALQHAEVMATHLKECMLSKSSKERSLYFIHQNPWNKEEGGLHLDFMNFIHGIEDFGMKLEKQALESEKNNPANIEQAIDLRMQAVKTDLLAMKLQDEGHSFFLKPRTERLKEAKRFEAHCIEFCDKAAHSGKLNREVFQKFLNQSQHFFKNLRASLHLAH